MSVSLTIRIAVKIYPDKLEGQLAKGLLPLYIVSGDEPLLVQESADLIRHALQNAGFTERDLFHVDAKFDWEQVLYSNGSMSLFAEKKILELRMSSAKPGDKGAKALTELCGNISDDTCVLLVMPRIDAAAQRTKWFKIVSAVAGLVQVWPVDAKQLPRWIDNRFKRTGLKASRDAVLALVEKIEGNLLAAVQEIERMKLCATDNHIDVDMVMGGVADSSRYDVFVLIDAALEGNVKRSIKVMDGLQLEGVEPLYLNSMLAREIRSLSAMSFKIEQGQTPDAVMQSARVWANRKGPVGACLQRHNTAELEQMQLRLGVVDRMVKGLAKGRAWDELTSMVLELSSQPVRAV